MPNALAAAATNLRQRGFLVAKGHVLQTLPRITRVIFDKTGTLTKGRLVWDEEQLCDSLSRDRALILGAALEANANHSLTNAVESWAGKHSYSDERHFTSRHV